MLRVNVRYHTKQKFELNGEQVYTIFMGQDQSSQSGVVVPVVGSGAALAQAAEAAAAEDAALLDAVNAVAVPPATLGGGDDTDEASQLVHALNALVVTPSGGGEEECVGVEALDGGARVGAIAKEQRRLAQMVGVVAKRAGELQAAVNASRVAAPGVARVADTVDRLAMDVADVCATFREAVNVADSLASNHFDDTHELASFANYLRANPIEVKSEIKNETRTS